MNSKLKLNLFSIASGLMMVHYFIGDAMIIPPTLVAATYNVAFIIFVSISVIDFIYKPLNKKSLLFISLFLILSMILYKVSNRNDIYMMLVIGLAFRDIDVGSFLLRDLINKTIVTLIVVGSALPYTTFDENFFNVRQTLGFGHPNSLGMMVALIAIELMYVTRKTERAYLFSYGVSIFFILFDFFVCRSRTSLMVLALALVSFVLLRFNINIMKSKTAQFIIRNLYIICTGISILILKIYDSGSQLGVILNKLFSNRPMLASHYLDIYNLNFFGNNAKISYELYYENGIMYFVVDMGYIWIPLIYGFVGVALFALLYNLTLKKLFKKEKYHCIVLIILMFVFCFMENTFIRYRFNAFIILLAFGFLYFEDEEKEVYLNKYLLTGFIALYICCALFHNTICNFDSILLLRDNANIVRQFALLENYYASMHNMTFDLYNWSLGYGASFFTMIKDGILSPFNLLILPFSKDVIPQLVVYLNMFKLILLSLFSCLWLSKLIKDRYKTILLSLLVTFSGIIVLYWGHGFFDCFVLLPLCLYCVESNIKNNKIMGLILSLIVLLFTNCVYAIPLGIFILLYYFSRINNYKNGLKLVLIVLLTVGFTSFIMIPALSFLTQESYTSTINLLIKTFLPIKSHNFALCAMLCFSLLIIFIENRIKYTIGFFISVSISLVFRKFFFDAVMFIPYLYIVLMLTQVFGDKKNKYKYYLIEMIVIVLVLIGSLVINKQSVDVIFKQVSLIVITLISIFYLKDNTSDALSIVLIVACLISNNVFINNVRGRNLKIDYSTLSSILGKDNGFYRIINDDGSNKHIDKLNDDYLFNYTYLDTVDNVPGVLNNRYDYNPESSQFIDMFNRNYEGGNYLGFNQNEVSFYDLLGTKYWYSSDTEKKPPSYFDKVDGEDYYINNYYVELGYVNNKTINSGFVGTLNPFEQEMILREYVALDESENTDYDLICSYNLTLLEEYTSKKMISYRFDETINNATLVVNNGGIPVIDVELYKDDVLVKREHFYTYDFCNIEIDSPIDRFIIRCKDVDGSHNPIRVFMTTPNRELEKLVYQQRIENCFENVVVDDDKISADIHIDKDNSLVYTYVPYDKNWKVYVDGDCVETMKANYGFVSFRIYNGQHHVEFIYEMNNSLKILSPISLCGLLVIIGVDFLKKKKM